jgi:nicotinate-nucleotide adenylyltransferase
MSLKKLGFFGGTFDPIHFGHLNLAIELLEAKQLDEIIFCPAHVSPLKKESPPQIASEHRKEMVSLAIAPVKEFTLFDWELNRPQPSYTIDTVRYILTQSKDTELYLILGDDVLPGLSKWKDVEELFRLAPPLLGHRIGKIPAPIPESLLSIIEKGEIKIPTMEISSTVVRERLKQGKFCGHLVPEPVLEYIYKNNLYEK